MSILITGASGLLGGALVSHLRSKDISIYCQSRIFRENTVGITWIKHDLIYDSWGGLSLPHIDVIYHLAGQTSTYSARQDPGADLASNVLSLLKLLEHFRTQQPPPFVVLAGTVTQVGLPDGLPINELFIDRPLTFYDISKLMAEMYLVQYVREGWIRGCTLRLSNVYGQRNPGQQQDRGIIDKIVRRAMSGESLTIFGQGDYIRDYIFIDDVVSAFVLASGCAARTNGRTFCIGTGHGVTLKEAFLKVVSLAASVTGKAVACDHVPPPEGLSSIEFRSAVIDSTAFRRATGWAPYYDLDAGLKASIQIMLARVDGEA